MTSDPDACVLIARPPKPEPISEDPVVLCKCRILGLIYAAGAVGRSEGRPVTARAIVTHTPGYTGKQRKAALRGLVKAGVVIKNGRDFGVNPELFDPPEDDELPKVRDERLAIRPGESRGERRRRLARESARRMKYG